ncbi:MAG: hypothetical protein ACXWVD_00210 [Telluria sp.]
MTLTMWARAIDLFFVACCTVVLAAALVMAWDGNTFDAIACFAAVLVNALWVRYLTTRAAPDPR